MKPNAMHALGRHGCHQCAPRDWRKTPNLTGDYDLDATILHRRNKDIGHRLELYLRKSGKTYGTKGAYSGSHGYHGDE